MKPLAVTAILAAAAAFGHHSFNGTYQIDQQVTLAGTITRVQLRNPHSMLELDVRSGDGTTRRWTIELGAAVLTSTLKTGDEVALTVSPRKSVAPSDAPSREGLLRTLRRASDQFEWGFKPGEVPQEWMPQGAERTR